MNGYAKSDPAPGLRRGRRRSEEAGERSRATGRGVGGAKDGGRVERGPAQHTPDAIRARVTQALDRVRHAARQRQKERFTALLHHVNVDTLRVAFYALK